MTRMLSPQESFNRSRGGSSSGTFLFLPTTLGAIVRHRLSIVAVVPLTVALFTAPAVSAVPLTDSGTVAAPVAGDVKFLLTPNEVSSLIGSASMREVERPEVSQSKNPEHTTTWVEYRVAGAPEGSSKDPIPSAYDGKYYDVDISIEKYKSAKDAENAFNLGLSPLVPIRAVGKDGGWVLNLNETDATTFTSRVSGKYLVQVHLSTGKSKQLKKNELWDASREIALAQMKALP